MTLRIPRLLVGGLTVIGVAAVIWLMLSIVQSALGQTQPSTNQPCTVTTHTNVPPKTDAVAGTAETTATVALPEVKAITGTIGIGSLMTLQVDGLTTYLDKTEKSAETIVPFINGRSIKGIHPICFDEARNQIQFRLVRTDDNKDVVDSILRASLYDDNIMDFKHEVLVSAGYEDEDPFTIKYNTRQQLIVAQAVWFWAWAAISIAVAVGLFSLAIAFDLLRVSPSSDEIKSLIQDYKQLGIKSAYSLGLIQVTWWFLLIFSAFIFLNFITWNINIITTGVAGLLGISVATAIGSVAINSSSQTSEQIDKILKSYKEKIDSAFSRFPDKIDSTTGKAVKTTIENALPDEIERVRKMAHKAVLVKRQLMLSENFLKDLLYDANGGGLNRVQIIIWTIVLGCMFAWTVATTLRMPEFDTVLLALIGLSAGTYIGLKIPGRPT